MDTLTVVIKMTGLLLMVPPGQGGGPTHVVLPATGNSVPPHLALLAYATPTPGPQCVHYDPTSGMCFVNLEGWGVELSTQGTASGNPAPTLGRGMASVTQGSGGLRVRQPVLGPNPGRRVRSRLTLNRGNVTNECAPGVFTFDPVGAPPEDTIPLTSVLEWTMSLEADSVPLVFTPLDPSSGDSAVQLEVFRPGTGPVELFIVHLPVWEDDTFFLAQTGPAAAEPRTHAQMQGQAQHSSSQAQGGTTPWAATHFHAYYDLLRAGGAERALPYFLRSASVCEWGLKTLAGEDIGIRSPTTFTCMLATASQ